MPQTKTSIAVIGAGKIGETIVDLLLESDDYQVTLIDSSAAILALFPSHPSLTPIQQDVLDPIALEKTLAGHFAVLSSTPFFLTRTIAQSALNAGCHYLDLTEDVDSTNFVRELSAKASSAFIPQCGLAPGFISIVTQNIVRDFDELDAIRMAVGALPQYPSNSLSYNLTWSTDGVINEYCEPCVCVEDGKITHAPALENLQHFSLDGIKYETFNTSGGIGSLAESLAGKVSSLSYQTIRYPGHRDIMKTLLHDLRLKDRRDLLKDVLETAIPATLQDVVLIFVTVSGKKNGRLIQQTYANKVYGKTIRGIERSAIQVTTASSICAVLDLLRDGKIPDQGFIMQEDIALDLFLSNRFGRVYATQQKHLDFNQTGLDNDTRTALYKTLHTG
ncbi:MAG: saccharopine dehydrogenase-like NADP-dependent oxidoreductase [Saprospiraceae bacterium]|jgi:saccharopine dehydrogenase-like NADP-dependent oxidoreductase